MLVWREEVIARTQGHASMAGPAIGRGIDHQARANRIELDITLAIGEISLRLHDGATVAPLPYRSGPPVKAIHMLHVAPADALDHARDGFARRTGHQDVDMVRHEDVRMDRHVIGLGGQLQAAEEIETVRILEENVLAIVAPHHHVLRDSGDETSSEPGHAETTSRSPGGGQDWRQIGQRQATLTPNLRL